MEANIVIYVLKHPITKGVRYVGKTKKRKCTNITSTFKKGRIPWNKDKRKYKLSGSKQTLPIVQYDFDGKQMNCIGENIRRCCVGKQKSAKGFIWKYK